MLDCKSMATPMDTKLNSLSNDSSELLDMTQYRQIIGSLMYLTNTRPYIFFDVNTLSQYLVKPRWVHMIAAKNAMRCLKGTIDLGLYYGRNHDSDWARSTAKRKSTSSGCYCLGSTMISWFSKKQSSIALSIGEAKYIAACSASCEAIWL